ncbi:MAG: 16S rRNA (cytidine(1402)-2'-O)-methyltransferase [Verrucomicrobia bacterium]|nr:16S rRNA (cytidine(1402)-2'-O)-methyltransferase [Verrucomicrobiota bacterium]
MLYLISTPIGNLEDITYRAVKTLQSCDLILCEDTRHSQTLLSHYGIDKPLKSFHSFNEKSKEDFIIDALKNGQNIALISDAGTPGICDPGEALVRRCYQENIPITALPGPCAFVAALSLCPFPKDRVQFLGFFEKESLPRLLAFPGITVFYDAPHRILQTLALLHQHDPARNICILRELTKHFEEHLLGKPQDLLSHFEKHPPKGEFVVICEGSDLDFSTLSEKEHVLFLQKEYHLDLADSIRLAAELRGQPKRKIYQAIHKKNE